MTIAEAERFYKQDNQEYLVENNSPFISLFCEFKKKGYHSLLDIEGMQDFIHNIQNWYEIKYPERELETMEGVIHTNFKDIKSISNVMDTRQFMYRLPHSQLCFLECGYRSRGWGSNNTIFMSITERPDSSESRSFEHTSSFHIIADFNTGAIRSISLSELAEVLGEDYSESNTDINLEKLYAILSRKIGDSYDLNELRRCILHHNCDFEIRNKILQLAALQLLYSKNTTPERGYFRAKKFIQEFNESFGLKLSTDQIDEIMKRDYSKEDTSIKKGIKSLFKKIGEIKKESF